jgi:hypothetical protein
MHCLNRLFLAYTRSEAGIASATVLLGVMLASNLHCRFGGKDGCTICPKAPPARD